MSDLYNYSAETLVACKVVEDVLSHPLSLEDLQNTWQQNRSNVALQSSYHRTFRTIQERRRKEAKSFRADIERKIKRKRSSLSSYGAEDQTVVPTPAIMQLTRTPGPTIIIDLCLESDDDPADEHSDPKSTGKQMAQGPISRVLASSVIIDLSLELETESVEGQNESDSDSAKGSESSDTIVDRELDQWLDTLAPMSSGCSITTQQVGSSRSVTLDRNDPQMSSNDPPRGVHRVKIEAAIETDLSDIEFLPLGPLSLFTNKTSVKRCSIAPIEGKGLGLVASGDLPQGQTIVVESPFLVVDWPTSPKQIAARVKRLRRGERKLFHSFQSSVSNDGDGDNGNEASDEDKLRGIVERNSIPLGGDAVEYEDNGIVLSHADGIPEKRSHHGMFEYICRVNHSCVPNARWTWYEAEGVLMLKAIRPIASNEEITACYLQDPSGSFAERQAILSHTWRFTCSCAGCILSTAARKVSNQRLKRYRHIRAAYIGDSADHHDNWECAGLQSCWTEICEGIELLRQEERISEMGECWRILFLISVCWGNERLANKAGKKWEQEAARMGDTLPGYLRALLRSPRSSKDWGSLNNEVDQDDDEDGDFGLDNSPIRVSPGSMTMSTRKSKSV